MSARNRELLFLIPAVLLTTIGFALVYTQQSSTLSWHSLTYGVIFLALFGLAHVGRRFLAPYADPYLLPLTALLATLGILVIYRINQKLALQQALWLVVGLAVFLLVLVFVRDLKVLFTYRFLIGLAGILVLLFTAVFGSEVNGGRLWVHLGPIGFEPPEFAKILLVVFFAAYLVDVREALTVSTQRILGRPVPPWRRLAPLLGIWALAMALMIFMRDLGMGLLFFGALLALLYVATGRFFYVAVGLVLLVGGAALLYKTVPYVHLRIEAWLDPWKDPAGNGYQIVQSLFALAAGGLFGSGLGQGDLISQSGHTIIPALETDFIFSAVGEELGLVGAVAVILLYLLFVYRGFRMALRAQDDFLRLLAVGLTTVFGLQAFLIIGGVVKLIPLTGITLPFVSYGGSSIVANFAVLALLLRISDTVARQEAGKSAVPEPALEAVAGRR